MRMIQPRNDRVLIRRIDEQKGLITLTDAPKGLKGTVLAVGPGKWHEGDWEYRQFYAYSTKDEGGELLESAGEFQAWEWEPGWRQEPSVKPGDTVLFNSVWNDFSKDHYDDLPLEAEPTLHLIQEADIFGILNA
jgi:co-chaperonin GroES (HSP10)